MPALSSADQSVQALRVETEASRARLTGTVEDLRTQMSGTATDIKERLSPSAIKAEIADYVQDSRNRLLGSWEQKARDNPLQAVALGAAVAYPALKILRAMPAPILLVGAGFLLSRTTSNVSDASKISSRIARDAAGALATGMDAARSKIHDAQDLARDGVDTVMESATAAASSIKNRVTETAEGARTVVSNTTDKVTSQVQGLSGQAREIVRTTWDQNPLLVAGAGLAIGAFIAAAFPSTATEDDFFSEKSDALRRQAANMASKGLDAARTAVEGATTAATDQGLSIDGLTKVGETLTEKARAVAERGIDAALSEAKTGQPT